MTSLRALVITLSAVCCASPAAAKPVPLHGPYRVAAKQITERALKSDGAYEKLEYLADRIGHRLSGSEALDRAIDWAASTMTADGLANVRKEKVLVPRWVRGVERASLVAPARHPVRLLALGGSAGTPAGGLVAPVLVVTSFEELEAKAKDVAGKIVLYDVPLPPYGPKGSGYGETVQFRSSGPLRAAKLGAVAALVRSVTATSLRTPHTGATRFDPDGPRIPAAAISVEDSMLIARLARKDTVKLELELGAASHPDVESANVVGELRGRELPDEIVLLGAHIDSWDVGQGAHDDGAGCVMIMEALKILRELGLVPRRTIRVVLFTNEENGLRGAVEYAKTHAAELANHVVAVEADTGGFKPLGFRVETDGPYLAEAMALSPLLAPIGAGTFRKGYAGADISVLEDAKVPLLGLDMDGSKYFDYHHSEADTFDKVNAEDLRRDVAAMAILAYTLAELPRRFGSNLPPEALMAAERDRQIQRVLLGILALNLAVAAAKGVYGALSGSLAVSSDALHSLLDGASNIVGLIALRIATRPPDREHPYGHAKVELVAAAVVGVFIAGGALRYGWNAIEALLSDRPPPRVGVTGFVVMAGTLAVNVLVAWWERRRGRALESHFLVADAAHTASDVLVTCGVIVSLGFSYAGLAWADPLASLAVLVVIAAVGWRILSSNVQALIDRAAVDPAALKQAVEGVAGVRGCHRVRSRGAGDAIHVDLHLWLDPKLPLEEAHEISHAVEARIRERFPNVTDVTIHPEPEGDPEEEL